MVRIACLISGVPRCFGTKFWIFLQNLIAIQSKEDVFHIFISFPKSSSGDRYFNTQKTRYDELIQHPNVQCVKLEDTCPCIFYKSHQRQQNIVMQWYRIQTLFDCLPSDSYDIVIRCRPDLEMSCTPQDFQTLLHKSLVLKEKEKRIYIPSGFDIYDHKCAASLAQPTINDQIAWGSQESMRVYCSTYAQLEKGLIEPLVSEAFLFTYLQREGIQIQRVNCPYHLRVSECVSIAICGESGAGKSTLAKLLQDILPFDQTLLLETDRYHKWERGAKEYQTYTHYHPEANHLEKLAEDAYSLHLGEDIFTVDYDHTSGKFTEPQQIESANYMILCGLHTLYKDSLRDIFDLKLFLDTEESLTHTWKIERDMKERSASRETILRAIEKRRDDFLKFIAPQKQYADILIQFRHDKGFVYLRIGIQNQSLFHIAHKAFAHFQLPVVEEDSILWFSCLTPPPAEQLNAYVKEYGYTKSDLADGFNGLLQLLCIAIIWKPSTSM